MSIAKRREKQEKQEDKKEGKKKKEVEKPRGKEGEMKRKKRGGSINEKMNLTEQSTIIEMHKKTKREGRKVK